MPLDTVLCLDTSGSMAGRGMRELVAAVENFLEGVEETAKGGLKENIAVVEFGKRERVVQSLTNDYGKVRNAIRSLEAGGRTPMFNGLMLSLKEIVANGGVVSVIGRKLSPRIILMTDGVPTNDDGESDDAKAQVLVAAASFGPKLWSSVGLPHPIPIACVGCGDCSPDLLDAIAEITNGMFVIVDNISELSSFFKKQVLLIKFAAQFAGDMEKLNDALVLRQFIEDMGEDVGDDEVQGLLRLLLTMMGLEAAASLAAHAAAGSSSAEETYSYPPLGSRVRRGRDWKWGPQDKGDVGTIVSHEKGGCIRVEWDHGASNGYRWGADNARDLKVVNEPRKLLVGGSIKVGVEVKRGKDWKWNDQDGGSGNNGVVYGTDEKGWVSVRWKKNGKTNNYRYGKEGCFDVEVVPSVFEKPAAPRKQTGSHMCWQWKDKIDEKDLWRLFNEDLQKTIEAAYSKDPKGTQKVQINNTSYDVNFKKMEQKNVSSNNVRSIRRKELSQDEYELAVAIEIGQMDIK